MNTPHYLYLAAAAIAVAFTSCAGSSEQNADEAAEQPTCKTKIRKALFIGDSITDGSWGHDCQALPSAQRNHTDLNHIYGHGYMYLCASQLQSQYPDHDIEFFNRGISGHTLKMMADRWASDCVDLRPDLVSVLVGTNEGEYFLNEDSVVAHYDFAAWEQLYRHTLDTLISVCPDVKLVLCTPFVAKSGWRGDMPNYPQRQEMSDSLDVRVIAIAKDYGATLVRFDSLFRDLATIQPRPDYWIWDGVHPTAAGHRRMADLWLKEAGDMFAE